MQINRVDLSRAQLLNAFYYALGGYAAHEEWQRDPWRDLDIGQLLVECRKKFDYILPHLKHLHEVIVGKDNSPDPAWKDDPVWHLIKHSANLTVVSTILLTRVMEKVKLLTSVQSKPSSAVSVGTGLNH